MNHLERLDQAFIEVPSKEEVTKFNLIKSIFKSRFPSDFKYTHLLESSFYHNTPLFVQVSLG
jgi:hypothetical protein